MKVRVFPGNICGTVNAPLSKSYAHRYLIAAALSGAGVAFGDSADARSTATALKAMGFSAKFSDNSVKYGSFKRPEGRTEICVKESGSTLRFLLPLAAALGVEATFQTEGRLADRPMGALAKALSQHGAEVSSLSVRGKLTPGKYEIDATISSQFVSGLLMALPLLDGDSEIVLLGRAVSASYIEITLEVLRAAGIAVIRSEKGFLIPGGQTYRLRGGVVPGDLSGAAFPLTAGALGGTVAVKGISLHTAQGDTAIVDLLEEAGAIVLREEACVSVTKNRLLGFRADVSETPDLAPILAVLAAYSTGESVLYNVSRLRDKESDRLAAVEDMLKKAGIAWQEEGDKLIITGGEPHGADFSSFSDHRMAMAEAVLAAYASGESTIDDMTCVEKSYPAFWKDFAALGGKYEVEG